MIDARSGEVLYAENSDTRLHPASLTKMMTLYIAFEEISRGNISLDSMVTISKHAAAQPPSRLGLRAGQKIQLRYLIRAAAIKSANDAATAIGEFIGGGSEPAFAERMTRTAHAIGMDSTTFKNANGLTAKGHLSTAHDLTVLGRRLFYDFPQFYNLFSRRSTDAGLATVNNTNRRFLDKYEGADGIKTGYTVPAGFNLTASAERDGKRLIATVMGGTSTDDRNRRMMKLLDKGFAAAPQNAPVNPPPPADYQGADEALVAEAGATPGAKTITAVVAPTKSLRPQARPTATAAAAPVVDETALAAAEAVDGMQDSILGALAEATGTAPAAETQMAEAGIAEAVEDLAASGEAPIQMASADPMLTDPSQTDMTLVEDMSVIAPPQGTLQAQAAALDGTLGVVKKKRNAPIYDDVQVASAEGQVAEEVVVSMSTSGDRHWGISVGRYPSSFDAEKVLLKTQLTESATLNQSLRKVVERKGGYEATFAGLTQEQADLACRRLVARGLECTAMGPES
ncbi:MAG: D-alanyl-D-alanine carboxypeptidase [Rhodobacteraceae bacterium PARR1]|nr:MAG: D-alanyl-D-alanine carboxypeptidase [Rhodobacteraceae bacterium PARR1]